MKPMNSLAINHVMIDRIVVEFYAWRLHGVNLDQLEALTNTLTTTLGPCYPNRTHHKVIQVRLAGETSGKLTLSHRQDTQCLDLKMKLILNANRIFRSYSTEQSIQPNKQIALDGKNNWIPLERIRNRGRGKAAQMMVDQLAESITSARQDVLYSVSKGVSDKVHMTGPLVAIQLIEVYWDVPMKHPLEFVDQLAPHFQSHFRSCELTEYPLQINLDRNSYCLSSTLRKNERHKIYAKTSRTVRFETEYGGARIRSLTKSNVLERDIKTSLRRILGPLSNRSHDLFRALLSGMAEHSGNSDPLRIIFEVSHSCTDQNKANLVLELLATNGRICYSKDLEAPIRKLVSRNVLKRTGWGVYKLVGLDWRTLRGCSAHFAPKNKNRA